MYKVFNNSGVKVKKYGNIYFCKEKYVNYSLPKLHVQSLNDLKINHIKWRYLITVIPVNLSRKNTNEFVLRTDEYGLEKFSRKIRNRIRKSLKNCTFKRPSLNDLITFGLSINRKTLKSQNRKEKHLTRFKYWKRYISEFYSHDELTIRGAYYNNIMIGYIVVYKLEEKYIIHLAYIDKQYASIAAPMNGLLYTSINELINKNGQINISYGFQSFCQLPELDRFKSNMLFERIPCTRIYILHPILLLILRFLIFFYIKVLKIKDNNYPLLRKIIQLYQGYRILIRENANNKK